MYTLYTRIHITYRTEESHILRSCDFTCAKYFVYTWCVCCFLFFICLCLASCILLCWYYLSLSHLLISPFLFLFGLPSTVHSFLISFKCMNYYSQPSQLESNIWMQYTKTRYQPMESKILANEEKPTHKQPQ